MKIRLIFLILLSFYFGISCEIFGQAVPVSKTNPTKVYMHYMSWFDAPENPVAGGTYTWGWHWKMNTMNPNIIDVNGKRQIASHYYPLIGPYSSKDPAVVEYHLLLMKLSGIDGVLMDWYGSEGSNGDVGTLLTNSNALINRTADAGIQFGLILEDRFWSNIQNARNSLTYAKNNYFGKSNFIKVSPGNTPLVGVFGPITYQTPSQWTDILSYAGQDVEFLPLWYENIDAGSNADGEHAWIYSDYLTGLNNFYANRAPGLKTAMGVAYPGFHDFYVEGGAGNSYFYIPENNGITLNETLAKYDQYKSNLDFLQLATFNDFGEGTMFEPTLEKGYDYLVRLQQYTGVSYTQNDLEQVYRLFTLRKKYISDATKQSQLDQVFNYFVSLQINSAIELMNTVDSNILPVPVITSSNTTSGSIGTSFSYSITASNSPTSYDATNLPTGLTLNTSTGVISGIPTVSGTTIVPISASNSSGTGTLSLTININPAKPIITSSTTASGTVGNSFSYAITASNNPTSYNATGLPPGLTVNTSTGVISGIPTVSGTTIVSISASNSGGTGTLSLMININPAKPIITSSTTASGTVGNSFSYAITASNNPTSYNATGLPPGLTVNTSTGVISGIPTVSGTTIVSISASNSGGTGTQSLTISITNSGSLICYKSPGSVTINGNLSESGWNLSKTISKTVTGITDNSASFGVMWDNTYLYIGAKVLDTKLFSESSNAWDDDAVEIYIDANNNKSTVFDGKDNQIIKRYKNSSIYSKFAISGLKHAWAAITGGFTVEIAIPWAKLGITPSAGTSIGFDMGYDDDDNGGVRDGQAVWNGTINNYQSTSAYGTLTLSNTTSAKLSARSAISSNEFNNSTLKSLVKLYPNPVENGFISLSASEIQGDVLIQIKNFEGKTLQREIKNIQTQKIDLNVSRLKTGIYVIEIIKNGKTITGKFMVK